MTKQEGELLARDLAVLAEAFAEPLTNVRLAAYVNALRDLELVTLREAMADCQASMQFFPKIADLRDAEFGVRARRDEQRLKLLPAAGRVQLSYHCTSCEDTGFVRDLSCPGDGSCGIGKCGQVPMMHYPHTFTRKCFCRATNPKLEAQRAVMRRKSQERAGAR